MTAPVVPVAAALWFREGRVLLAERPIHKKDGGLWEFPGGKADAGETMVQALERELREELGIRLVRARWIQDVSVHKGSVDLILSFYLVEAEGEPMSLEGQRLGWFEPGDVASLPLCEGDRRCWGQHEPTLTSLAHHPWVDEVPGHDLGGH